MWTQRVTFNVGMAEVAPVSHVLHLQTYSSFKYDTLLTHEPMFRRDKDANLHGLLVKFPAGLVWSADDFLFSLENVRSGK